MLQKYKIKNLRVQEVSTTAHPINQKSFIKTTRKKNTKSTEEMENEMENVMNKSEPVIDSKSTAVNSELLKSQEVDIRELTSVNKSLEEENRILKSKLAAAQYNESLEARIPNVLKLTKSAGNLLEPLNFLRANNAPSYEIVLKSCIAMENVMKNSYGAVSLDLPKSEDLSAPANLAKSAIDELLAGVS